MKNGAPESLVLRCFGLAGPPYPKQPTTHREAPTRSEGLLVDLAGFLCENSRACEAGAWRPEGAWSSGPGRAERGRAEVKSGERSDRPSEDAPHTIRQFLTFLIKKSQKILKIKI